MPPRLARLLAAIVAVAMVGGAFAIRGALSGDDAAVEAGAGGGPGRGGPSSGGDLRLLCDSDLGLVCDELTRLDGIDEVAVVKAGDLMTSGEEAFDIGAYDAWLTLDPMPGVLREAHGGLDWPNTAPQAVASGRLSALTQSGSTCADATWACLIESAGPQNKIVTPALDTSLGMVAAGAALQGLVGDDLEERGIRAADEDPGRLIHNLTVESRSFPDIASTMVTRPGTYGAVIATEAVADRLTASRTGFEALVLEPTAVIAVVLVALNDEATESLGPVAQQITEADDPLVNALTQAGWPDPPAESTGLPASDIVYALSERLN